MVRVRVRVRTQHLSPNPNPNPNPNQVLTAPFLAECMACLTFGKFGGEFDIAIKGYGLDLKVSEVANTTLKEPKVGKKP